MESESISKSQDARNEYGVGWKIFKAIAFTPIVLGLLGIFVWALLIFLATVAPTWSTTQILEAATSYDEAHPGAFSFLLLITFLLSIALQFIVMDMETCNYVSESIAERERLHRRAIEERAEQECLRNASQEERNAAETKRAADEARKESAYKRAKRREMAVFTGLTLFILLVLFFVSVAKWEEIWH